jgi:glycosyltransferase involved in cell wall biosynthesis
VELAGFVADLEREHLEASLFVAPLLTGGGIIVKLLDAMAAGVPVVTTAIGNEGIGAQPGAAVTIAARPEEFAREVVALLGDPARRAAQAAAALRHVEARFSEKGLEAALEAAYGELTVGPRAD